MISIPYHEVFRTCFRSVKLTALFLATTSTPGLAEFLASDGRTWTPMEGGTKSNLMSVSAAGRNSVVAAGTEGVLLNYDGNEWIGFSGWRDFSDTDKVWNQAKELRAVGIDKANDVHVASYDQFNGQYAVWNAGTKKWKASGTGTTRRVLGLWCSPNSGLVALSRINSHLTIIKPDGTKTIQLPTLPDNSAALNAVDGDGDGNIWVVGRSNILRMIGSSADWVPGWSRISVPEAEETHWTAVFALDEKHVWAVGNNGRVAFWDGEKFILSTVGTATLRGVYAKDASSVWVVGDGGAAWYFNGNRWNSLNLRTNADLRAITGAEGRLWAVGYRGTILMGEKKP